MTATTIDPGRGPNGRFAPGNKGGPGNPHARHMAQFRKILFDLTTPEMIEEAVRALMDRVREGNLSAIRLFLGYLVGKPGKLTAEDFGDDDDYPPPAPPVEPPPGPAAPPAATDPPSPNGQSTAPPSPNGSDGPAADRPQTGETAKGKGSGLGRPSLADLWKKKHGIRG